MSEKTCKDCEFNVDLECLWDKESRPAKSDHEVFDAMSHRVNIRGGLIDKAKHINEEIEKLNNVIPRWANPILGIEDLTGLEDGKIDGRRFYQDCPAHIKKKNMTIT